MHANDTNYIFIPHIIQSTCIGVHVCTCSLAIVITVYYFIYSIPVT